MPAADLYYYYTEVMESTLTSELLQCAICLGELDNAYALPCLHSFCSPCLQGHISVSLKRVSKTLKLKRFPCPTCRVWINSPVRGVADFPKDFRVVKMKDALREWKRKGSHHRIVTCEMCEQDCDSPVEHYCADCQKHLCSQCIRDHDSTSVLSTHIVISLSSTQNGNQSKICSVHLNESIKYHCQTCSLGICVKCIRETHKIHQIVDLDYHSKLKKVEMRNCMDQLRTQNSLLVEVMFNLNSIEGHIRGQHEQIKLQIRKHSHRMINHVYREQNRLLSEADVHYQQRYEDINSRKEDCQKYIYHVTELQTRLESLLRVQDADTVVKNNTSLVKESQDTELVEKYSKELVDVPKCAHFMSNNVGKIGHIISRDQETAKPSCADLHQKYGRSDRIQTFEKDLKVTQKTKLIHDSKGIADTVLSYASDDNPVFPVARLLCQIGDRGSKLYQLSLPYGIAFTEDERLVVAENGTGRIQVYTKEGLFLRVVPLPTSCPRSLSLLRENKVVFTDENEKCLKILDIDTSQLFSVSAGHMEKTVSFPFGVASLSDGRFVVSDMIYETVSITTSTGITEKQLGEEDPSKTYDNPSYLATDAEDNIFISDSGNHKIKVYDKHGRFLFQFGNDGVKEGHLRYPKGIAVDKTGLIYVADAGNDRVVVFSRLGFFLTVLADKNYGVVRPTGLAYSPTGLLAVSMPDRHEVFVYQLENSIPRQL